MTHEAVGTALLQAAQKALGTLPPPTTVITVAYETDPDQPTKGLLILTDLYGATPSNIAEKLQHPVCQHQFVRIVSGLNLPMLIRVMNYAELPLDLLVEKAISGGKDGVINCSAQGNPHHH